LADESEILNSIVNSDCNCSLWYSNSETVYRK